MRILFINEVCGHTSTGKICAELAEKYEAEGNEVRIAYGRDNYVPDQYRRFAVRIGTDYEVKLHALYTRITDKHGLGSKNATRKFLKWADKYNPDMLWLHNLHGYYINYELLFGWIKSRPQIEVKWTLHDCWAFTGHCSHYCYAKCSKWKEQCFDCPQKKEYPTSLLLDNSRSNYKRKKQAFTSVKNLTIITPSHWLEKQVKESFLREYNIETHHNTINQSIFRPTSGNFRERNHLVNRTIILGVANVWNEKKGLMDFIKLSNMLSKEEYSIILVGLTDKQIKDYSENVIGISRTHDQKELAEIYTTADFFVNLTYEDTYPTVNLEAEACETKVISYCSGGAPETLYREDSLLVPTGEIAKVYAAIAQKRRNSTEKKECI